jgi:hypothetical protein
MSYKKVPRIICSNVKPCSCNWSLKSLLEILALYTIYGKHVILDDFLYYNFTCFYFIILLNQMCIAI